MNTKDNQVLKLQRTHTDCNITFNFPLLLQNTSCYVLLTGKGCCRKSCP